MRSSAFQAEEEGFDSPMGCHQGVVTSGRRLDLESRICGFEAHLSDLFGDMADWLCTSFIRKIKTVRFRLSPPGPWFNGRILARHATDDGSIPSGPTIIGKYYAPLMTLVNMQTWYV